MADELERPGRVAGGADDGVERIARAAVIRAWDRGDTLVILGTDGVTRRFDGDSAAMARAVLVWCAAPRTRAAIIGELARLAGVTPDDVPRAALDELLEHLRAAGVLVGAASSSSARLKNPTAPRRRGQIVLGITGAVAACDAPQLCRALLGRGHALRVAMTRNARRFVAADALRAITHAPIYASMWAGDATCPVPHINLAEWADLVLVAPASARTLARLAGGDFAELVTSVALATRAPVVIAPSMNDAMFAAASVQRNLERLRDDGFIIAHPALGIEVAHAPGARMPMLGPAPPAAALADLVEHILTETLSARAEIAGASDWERTWATTPAGTLPWHCDELDADIADALGPAAGRRLLDLGTGAGTAAIAAAARGFDVVAIDVAPSALAAAHHRAGGLAITWVQDDASQPRIWGNFDVLLDRGLLHVLPPARRAAYATSVARLAAPGARLLIKAHTVEAAAAHRTRPPTTDELRALLASDFELVDARPSTFPGPTSSPPATLYLFERRRASPSAAAG